MKHETRCEPQTGGGHEEHVEYEGYDGWYNNFARPSLGAVDTPLLRLLQPAYADGVYQPANRTTNPFTVSEQLMKGNNGQYSRGGRTAFQVFFGQQVVEEILDAQGPGCPPEYFNIPIEKDHEYHRFSPHLTEMPLLRTRYDMRTGFSPNNPRQQLNEITPYLDGGLVYGTSKAWADVLRAFPDGSLAPMGQLAWHHELGPDFPAQNTQRMPMANPPPPTNHSEYVARSYTANVDRFFKLGNPRGNENPFLLTFGILWFRWHNHIAKYLAGQHDDWTDEKVFNEARKWVIATYQAVVLYDWLPKYMRRAPGSYTGYKPTTDPQVSHVFQTAAMRFGHTLVTSGVHLRSRSKEGCKSVDYSLDPGQRHRMGGVRTCNSFWRSPELFTNNSNNFEQFLMGLSSQSSEREDNIIVDDLRGRVFGPLEFSRRDLMAINIQRGRDHGLPDYNTARQFFGLQPLESLSPTEYRSTTHTSVNENVLNQLQRVYSNVNKVDIWPGGLLETTTTGPGELFTKIILDQFERVRDGDRFWFENDQNNLFTEEEQERIRNIRIIDVILSVTSLIPGQDIQLDPFTAVHNGNGLSQVCVQQMVNAMCTLPGTTNTTACRYLPQVSDSNSENCTQLYTYDYFSGSKASYIITFTLVLAACVGLLIAVIVKTKVKTELKNREQLKSTKTPETNESHKAKENVTRSKSRYVMVVLDVPSKRIQVKSTNDNLLRTIDLSNVKKVTVRHLQDCKHIIVKVEHHYDLSLQFADSYHGEHIFSALKKYCSDLGLQFNPKLETRASILVGVTTVYQRQKQLVKFCRFVMQNAFGDQKQAKATENLISIAKDRDEILTIEITKDELASELGMLPDSIFVKQLFHLMDTDSSGFITIKEFWDVMVVLAQGTQEAKARLMFNIYDLTHSGSISANDFYSIIQSNLGSEAKEGDTRKVVQNVMHSVGVAPGETISFDKFKEIFIQRNDVFSKICLDIGKKGNREISRHFSLYVTLPEGGLAGAAAAAAAAEACAPDSGAENTEDEDNLDEPQKEKPVAGTLEVQYYSFINWIRSKVQYVFWLVLYTLVMFLIFIERAYVYSVESEQGGLRRIAGYGVTVTRGAASAMMFTYSTLLVTMCRNIFSQLRSTNLHRLVPFDHMIEFHRYIGFWALVWTLVHVIGHSINFYHIATQTPPDLSCLFRDYFRSTHVLPKFHYWCWETITGLTGVLLTLQVALIYVFAYFGRQNYFPYFWHTHNTYPLFYLLIVLHGSGRLVQPPIFHFFFLGPCILFVLDKLISISRSKNKIGITKVIKLPSDVLCLEIRRPPGFNFQSGQWVKIASIAISEQEYHPFTLSSAPHEDNITLHIRAVGPWTRKLMEVYANNPADQEYPKIYMDGPFGEGHQNWWEHEVIVMVAGGIGVTPFASILKDIAHKLQNSKTLFKTRKVVFLWTTRSQKQYEWLIDILREVEASNKQNIISIHIFITQFTSKYDLRTIMLYMAERHFQRVSGTSLFTGLKAITHFSRPNFVSIFTSLKKKHKEASIIGVFTCGSSTLSNSVQQGCQEMNKGKGVVFDHYYKNF